MNKQKLRLFIPLFIIGCMLIYSWANFLSNKYSPAWQHYLAIDLFSVLIILLINNFRIAIVTTGIYLLLSTFAVISLTPAISASGLIIMGTIKTPAINLLSFGLFILYGVLNLDELIDIYLDYEKTRIKRKG